MRLSKFLALLSLSVLLMTLACSKEVEIKENVLIKIAIINGFGKDNAAVRFREAITIDDNIKVVRVANAKNFIYDKTKVIARSKDEKKVNKIKRILGLKQSEIDFTIKNTEEDFEIILGKDMQRILKNIGKR